MQVKFRHHFWLVAPSILSVLRSCESRIKHLVLNEVRQLLQPHAVTNSLYLGTRSLMDLWVYSRVRLNLHLLALQIKDKKGRVNTKYSKLVHTCRQHCHWWLGIPRYFNFVIIPLTRPAGVCFDCFHRPAKTLWKCLGFFFHYPPPV